MDFNLSEQQRILRQSARDFLTKEISFEMVKEMPKDKLGYPSDLMGKMADLGWLGLIIPEEFGGVGGNFLDLTLLLEEMGRACLPGPFFSTVVLAAQTILEAGSESQKRDLLGRIANGEILATVAVSEPEMLRNPAALAVTAKADGQGYVINGTKLFVPDGHVANYIICVAKTEQGPTLFLVDAKASGVQITLTPTMAADKFAEVKFEGVRVSKADVLGEAGKGWDYWQRVETKAAVAKAAEVVGGSLRALDLTLDYAKQRVQFGRVIGANQAVQHQAANMATDVEGGRYVTYRAAWLISEGLPHIKEASIAKAWVSDAARRAAATGIQLHGAIGFCEEHDMPLYYKQAKLGEIAFGDAAYHEEIVAQQLGL